MIRAVLTALALASAPLAAATPASAETAIFAGGCSWRVEPDFDHVAGVTDTVSGYIGGENENPTYKNHPGHVEAVRIEFDPAKVSYKQLVDAFFRSVNPTDPGGQFCDRGHSHTTAIFATSAERRRPPRPRRRRLSRARQGDRHADRRCAAILECRGLPPELLQEEPDPLPVLPLVLRPQRDRRGSVGRRGLSRHRPLA